MMRGQHSEDGTYANTCAERLLVEMVRRALGGAPACVPAQPAATALAGDLLTVATLFRRAQATMIRWQGVGLMLAPAGTVAFNRHERRLLRAAAAAQADDDGLADNYLFKLAPHPRVRPGLARAVIFLATSLAVAGYWLAALPLPASALPIARLRGIGLNSISVAWPHAGTGAPILRPH